jgi:hypothetical protein
MRERPARAIDLNTIGWIALISGVTISVCFLLGFAVVIAIADCGRAMDSTVCSDGVRPQLSHATTVLSVISLVLGSGAAFVGLVTKCWLSARGGVGAGVGGAGLGLTLGLMAIFTLYVFAGTGDRPRMPYPFFACGLWIIATVCLIVAGLTALVRRAQRSVTDSA